MLFLRLRCRRGLLGRLGEASSSSAAYLDLARPSPDRRPAPTRLRRALPIPGWYPALACAAICRASKGVGFPQHVSDRLGRYRTRPPHLAAPQARHGLLHPRPSPGPADCHGKSAMASGAEASTGGARSIQIRFAYTSGTMACLGRSDQDTHAGAAEAFFRRCCRPRCWGLLGQRWTEVALNTHEAIRPAEQLVLSANL